MSCRRLSIDRTFAPTETPANDDALYIDPSSTSLVDRVSEGDECVVEITTNANNTNELQWEAEDESIQAPKKIELNDPSDVPAEHGAMLHPTTFARF
ncbi:hypothetical protein THAOC_22264 [Thalassiosira oceanica]|uniref:Uncharacterized protein n=1 Tax=Thalassiosira oceanica TaxID=159749 RepID=K0RXJ9_THAOC|nr:hypothetical protein THAOC_22264 [Thalassiosira oceanica]|eukprot:EJK57665.1 hypothetical protein THAOC_22264 [Thalassiosira oceanica]